jgi:leucyl aminopeptidase
VLDAWPQWMGAAVEGAILANYRFEMFRPAKTKPLTSLRCTVEKPDLADARRAGKRAEVLATATNYAREIANQPGNLLYPETLAAEARQLGNTHGLRVTILDELALRAGKFGGLLASAAPDRN